jgi:cell division septation protein DedD
MADNKFRSDRGRDPLAALARLIAQGDPYAESASGYDAPRSSVAHVDWAAQDICSSRDDQVNERHSHAGERYTPSPPSAPSYSHAAQERGYENVSAGISGPATQSNGFREVPAPDERDEVAQPPPGHQLSTYATAPDYETAPERSYETSDEHRHHDKAYAADDEACAADEDYADAQSTRRRSSLVLVTAIFGLAVVGTAGAFGYRATFGGPVLPTLPPISKANKIAPASAVLEAKNATNTNQAGATTTGSTEKLVSREEQEEQSVKPNPRVISTIPIMPGQGWLAGAATPAVTTPAAVVQMAPNQAIPGPLMSVWPPSPAMAAPTAPAAAAPIPAPPPQVLSEPKKIHTVPYRADPSGAADARPEPTPPAALANANSTAAEAPSVLGGGYAVQVTSERSESNAQAAVQALQSKYPNQLSGRQPIIRRADLGSKGTYYRVLVGPFASAEEAAALCSRLKAAGGNCIVQRN